MKRPSSPPVNSSPNKKPKRTPRIEPFHWNRNYLTTLGITVRFDLQLPAVAPPPQLLNAIQNTLVPCSDTFRSTHSTVLLRRIASCAYDLTELTPTPRDAELRNSTAPN